MVVMSSPIPLYIKPNNQIVKIIIIKSYLGRSFWNRLASQLACYVDSSAADLSGVAEFTFGDIPTDKCNMVILRAGIAITTLGTISSDGTTMEAFADDVSGTLKIASIGGSAAYSSVLSNVVTTALFVTNCVAFILANGLNGLEFDWTEPNDEGDPVSCCS